MSGASEWPWRSLQLGAVFGDDDDSNEFVEDRRFSGNQHASRGCQHCEQEGGGRRSGGDRGRAEAKEDGEPWVVRQMADMMSAAHAGGGSELLSKAIRGSKALDRVWRGVAGGLGEQREDERTSGASAPWLHDVVVDATHSAAEWLQHLIDRVHQQEPAAREPAWAPRGRRGGMCGQSAAECAPRRPSGRQVGTQEGPPAQEEQLRQKGGGGWGRAQAAGKPPAERRRYEEAVPGSEPGRNASGGPGAGEEERPLLLQDELAAQMAAVLQELGELRAEQASLQDQVLSLVADLAELRRQLRETPLAGEPRDETAAAAAAAPAAKAGGFRATPALPEQGSGAAAEPARAWWRMLIPCSEYLLIVAASLVLIWLTPPVLWRPRWPQSERSSAPPSPAEPGAALVPVHVLRVTRTPDRTPDCAADRAPDSRADLGPGRPPLVEWPPLQPSQLPSFGSPACSLSADSTPVGHWTSPVNPSAHLAPCSSVQGGSGGGAAGSHAADALVCSDAAGSSGSVQAHRDDAAPCLASSDSGQAAGADFLRSKAGAAPPGSAAAPAAGPSGVAFYTLDEDDAASGRGSQLPPVRGPPASADKGEEDTVQGAATDPAQEGSSERVPSPGLADPEAASLSSSALLSFGAAADSLPAPELLAEASRTEPRAEAVSAEETAEGGEVLERVVDGEALAREQQRQPCPLLLLDHAAQLQLPAMLNCLPPEQPDRPGGNGACDASSETAEVDAGGREEPRLEADAPPAGCQEDDMLLEEWTRVSSSSWSDLGIAEDELISPRSDSQPPVAGEDPPLIAALVDDSSLP